MKTIWIVALLLAPALMRGQSPAFSFPPINVGPQSLTQGSVQPRGPLGSLKDGPVTLLPPPPIQVTLPKPPPRIMVLTPSANADPKFSHPAAPGTDYKLLVLPAGPARTK